MTQPKAIIGAGLAGLIAAHAWPQAQVFERMPEPTQQHRALLRFRSDAVARLTGIEFRKVRVRKGIWHSGYRAPDIQLANMYAQKVGAGLSGDRSIWDISPVDRWIAPDNLYDQLVDNVRSRVRWDCPYDFTDENPLTHDQRGVVSTMPLPELLNELKVPHPNGTTFKHAGITVRRYIVEGADLYQTVYFPSPHHSLYRASMSGATLIMEFVGERAALHQWAGIEEACHAFAIEPSRCSEQERRDQRYGKIVGIDDATRKGLLLTLTQYFGVYSLGRFATWRNLLLDDVVQDIDVIKRLMRVGHYDMRRTGA